MALSVSQQIELRSYQNEAEAISKKSKLTDADRARFNFLRSAISVAKQGTISDEARRAEARSTAIACGVQVSDAPFTEAGIETREQNQEIRSYLRYGQEAQTRSGMSVATDNAGGYFVPAGYFRDRIFSSLKAADRLFDENVVTFYESNDGNVLTVPMMDDTEVSAAIVSENAQSTEGEVNTVDRLQLAKVPTWRSKQIVWSLELLQDTAFPAEALIADVIASRFQRGIGASNGFC
jgi:HK97 family phage major capsid protein